MEKPNKHHGALIKLIALMKPYWKGLLIAVLLVLIANLAELINPKIYKIIVDEYLVKPPVAQHGVHWFTTTLLGLGVSYFLVILVSACAALLQRRMMTRMCQRLMNDLRIRVFAHIHRMKLSDMDRMGSGRLLTRATNDIEALDGFYGDVLLGLFKDLFLLVGIVIMMVQMNWRLALIGFTAVPVIVGITMVCKGALKRNFQKMKAIIGHINAFIAESLSGIRVIQAFRREREKTNELIELDVGYKKTTMFQVMINSVLRPVMEVVNSAAIVVVLLAAYQMAGGTAEYGVGAGVLVAFTTYIKKFFQPINDLAEKYNNVQSALVSADRIFSLLDDRENLEDLDKAGYAGEMRGEVKFDHVWFAYTQEEWVLRDVSFSVKPGEKIAFVGATGAGKTTIISLISRFYDCQRGTISVDGIPIADWQLGALRSQIAVVLQDVFLFVGTVADNVRIHAPIDDAAVEEALAEACALPFVEQLPQGLHTMVAERGATFSTGERQLISFARAIAHAPRLLVLDEATANIDSNTEETVQASLKRISEGRTSIFIAHRLSTIRSCDMIYYLENGQIAECGTHAQLMSRESRYRALVTESETAA